jgi:hypothetical protein
LVFVDFPCENDQPFGSLAPPVKGPDPFRGAAQQITNRLSLALRLA